MVAATIAADAVLNPPNSHSLSRHEQRTASMLKIKQCAEMVREQLATQPQPSAALAPSASSTEGSSERKEGGGDRAGVGKAFEDAFYGLMSLLDPSWSIRMGVHYGLFASSVQSQGTAQQRQEWQRRIAEMRVIGCFAMTELGHGSNVSAIETTATYDARRGCFVLHSPTLTSVKWWIGGAAHMATHAAVYAQLVHSGVRRGVYCFAIRIRDSESGRVVAGVTIGDLGDKMGRQGLDNGWIRFDQLAVSRECMLSRWAEVDAAGAWAEKAGAGGRTTYAALIATRVELFGQCSDVLKQAATIAVRYGCVRRQGWRAGQRGIGEEVRLMDYETHQRRLLPIIAHAVAIQLTAKRVKSTVDAMLASLTTSSSSSSVSSSSVLSALESVHATTAGMKSFATTYVNDAVEVCRQSLGGQGYSVYALLPGVRADWAVMCTWEGDNTVLALQCAKHMLRRWDSRAGQSAGAHDKEAADPFAYITAGLARSAAPLTAETLRQPAAVVSLFRQRVQHMLRALTASSSSSQALLSERATDCIRLAKAHCDYYMLDCFAATLSASASTPASVRPILRTLFTTLAASLLLDSLSDFLLAALLPVSPSPAPLLSGLLAAELVALRPNAVALVDAFALPDMVLGPLGRADGRVYEALFECVQASGRSGGEEGEEAAGLANGVVDYWQELVAPLVATTALERGRESTS